jgi:hypothetical protein
VRIRKNAEKMKLYNSLFSSQLFLSFKRKKFKEKERNGELGRERDHFRLKMSESAIKEIKKD